MVHLVGVKEKCDESELIHQDHLASLTLQLWFAFLSEHLSYKREFSSGLTSVLISHLLDLFQISWSVKLYDKEGNAGSKKKKEASGEARTRGSSGRVQIRHRYLEGISVGTELKVQQEYIIYINQSTYNKMAFSAMGFVVASDFSTLTQK